MTDNYTFINHLFMASIKLTAAADFKLAADWIFFFTVFAASIKNL